MLEVIRARACFLAKINLLFLGWLTKEQILKYLFKDLVELKGASYSVEAIENS